MGIVNRRNAAVGWAVWKVAKRVGKKKIRSAKPAVEGRKPNKSLVAVAVAAAAGAFAFLRGRRGEDD